MHLYIWFQFLLNQILREGYDNVVQFLCHTDGHHSFAENMIQIFLVFCHYNSDARSGQLKWVESVNFIMKTTLSALLALCAGNSLHWSFDVFFDLCLNKRLSKQSRRRWFGMPSLSLWRHCNGFPWVWHGISFSKPIQWNANFIHRSPHLVTYVKYAYVNA